MNTLMKTMLSVIAFSALTGVAYADDEARGNDRPPTGCGELCSGSIPIELTVKKHCDLDVLTSKISLQDGGTGNGAFRVGANAPYNLLVSTDNGSKVKSGANEIPITVITTRDGSNVNIPLGVTQSNEPFALGMWKKYNVAVSSQEVGITKPAGVYTDNYRIRVFF